ncbi:hypothetical protein [Bradyrhizobium embrapense]
MVRPERVGYGSASAFSVAFTRRSRALQLPREFPYRTNVAEQAQRCGMFLTPTLRNSATRRVFFHNGVFTSLEQVLDFYNFRDTNPEKVYPRAADGTVQKYDELPVKHHGNVDVSDPPFERHLCDGAG